VLVEKHYVEICYVVASSKIWSMYFRRVRNSSMATLRAANIYGEEQHRANVVCQHFQLVLWDMMFTRFSDHCLLWC